MSRRRRWASAIAIAAVVLVALALARHPLASFLLQRGLGAALGYDVRFDDMRLGWSHATFTGVHVRKNGDPVLDAARIDVDYALRDVFPGGKHRYGFAGIAIDRPTLTLVRHSDGTFNVNRGGSSSTPPQPTQAAAEPLLFSARVRDGTIKLVDAAPLEADLAEQTIAGVAIDASVQSNARTVAKVDGTLIGRRSQSAPIQRWPLSVRSVIDYDRGLAMHHVRAAALPLRGMLNFLLHSKAARFDDGVMRDLDVKAYAIGITAATPFTYRMGGGGRLDDAQITLDALAKPVRGLHGTVDLFDDGVTSRDLEATVAGIPIHIRGGIYDLADVRFRLGVSGDTQLAQVRSLFTFLYDKPIRGPMHLETLVTASVAHPLIRTVVSSPRLYYGTIPLDHAGGTVDYSDGVVSFGGFHTGFGALQSGIAGQISIGPGGDLAGVLHIEGQASELPYAQAIAAGQTIGGDAIIGGNGRTGFTARGTIVSHGAGGSGGGFIAVDQRGTGEFGPFIFQRSDGSTFAGALRLERPISASAGWATLDHYRIDIPAHVGTLPGITIPTLPPIGGVVDAAIVAGGPPSAYAVAGEIRARDTRFEHYRLGNASAQLGGTFTDLRIHHIVLDGPSGHFRGDGAEAGGTFGVRGTYDGTFANLAAFTGDVGGRGSLRAPVLAYVDTSGVTVQTTGAALHAASIHGVPLEAAAGTLTVGPNTLQVVTGNAELGGAHAVAAGRGDRTAISMVGVPAAALAGAGLPLRSGRVSVYGIGNLQQQSFTGSVDLDHGVALGYPVGGWADLALRGRQVRVLTGEAALGSTYGVLAGQIDDVGGPDFHYSVNADVPLGDVGDVTRDLHLPVHAAEGSFAAHFRIAGDGAASGPTIAGDVSAPEGSYNGLAFRDGAGRLTVSAGALHVSDGRLTVGGTDATFRASLAPHLLGIAVAAPRANLADFDDYFDQGDMLAGSGSLRFSFIDDGRATNTIGAVALTGTRVRRFPLGTVGAHWSTAARTVTAEATIAGPDGTMHAGGRIVPAIGGPLAAVMNARYDADVTATGVELGTYLPAAGFTYPIAGQVAATGHVAGVFPHLAIGGHGSIAGGRIGPYPLSSAEVTTRILGDRVSVDAAAADLGFARLTATGSVGIFAAAPLALRVHASVPDLTEAARRVEPHRQLDVAGALETDAVIGGSFAHPHVTAGFDLEKPRFQRLLVQRIVGNLQTDLHSLTLDSAEFELNHGSAVLAGSLPIRLSPPGIGPPTAPLSLTADARGLDLASFAPLLPGTGTKLAGTIDGHLVLEGTVRAPRILGNVSLANGSYVSSIETSVIRNVAANLAFQGTSVALQALHADVGTGTLDAHGQLNLPIPGAPAGDYSVSVTAKNAQLYSPAFGGGTLNGTAQLTAGPRMPVLGGDLTVTKASIPFAAIFRAGGSSGEPPGPSVFDLAFNLRTTVQDVRIRSSIIDVGAAGSLQLTGTLRSPRAAGTFTATRGGVFSTYQRLFRIQDATVTFDPSQGIVPNLDLHATAHVQNPDPDFARNAAGSADITVSVTGPADAYTISYSSEPSYSQAQIIALLVDLPVLGSINFGRAAPPGFLRGAPGESNVLLPPGVTPYQTGTSPLSQEAFSLFNTQLTQRLISPLENAFGGALGLTDLELTLDYGGRIGYTARQQLSRKGAVSVTLGQVLSYPTRTQFGFQSQPNPDTTLSFTYFQQNGTPFYTNSIFGNTSTVTIQNGVQPLSDRQGFQLTLTRSSR